MPLKLKVVKVKSSNQKKILLTKQLLQLKVQKKAPKKLVVTHNRKVRLLQRSKLKLKKVSEDDLKEEDKPSKMNQIKAMVNKMKDMSKKELSVMYV